MKPVLHPALINGPLGDPGLLVQFMYEKRALLFDLGDLSALTNAALLKISHVFVTHTHIDHFYGFDRLLRISFGRGKTVGMYGPRDFLDHVEGKLSGFTWNLVDRYDESLTIEAVEVRADGLCRARFRAIDKFKRGEERREPFAAGGVLLDEPAFTVRAAILEHRVPCLGFMLEEKFHVNVRKECLDAMNLPAGSWLTELKRRIHEGAPDDFVIHVPAAGGRDYPLGELRDKLVFISPGQKIAYITDTVYTEENKKIVVDLTRGADIFFCESPFLAEETERALDRCHLTSRQAGLLAREARAKHLRLFHFSQKHHLRQDQLYREAEEAFGEAVVRH